MVDRENPAPERVGVHRRDGLKLSYEVHGEEGLPPIFCHPGLGFSREYFRPLAFYLRKVFQLFLFDPRACGESDGPRDPSRIDLLEMTEDVLSLLDAELRRPVLFLGHSLGANVALEACVRSPERFLGLVLLSPSVKNAWVQPHLKEMLDRAPAHLREVIVAGESKGPIMDERFAIDPTYAQAAAEIAQPHALRRPITPFIATAMRQSGPALGVLWGKESAFRITGSMKDLDQTELLPRISRPTLVLAGDDDAYCAPSLAVLERKFPGIRSERLTDSGHHGHVEEPARVAESVHRFAADLGLVELPSEAPLRSDVSIEEGSGRLEDLHTRFAIELGPLEIRIAKSIGRPLDEVAREVMRAVSADESDLDQITEEIRDFREHLDRIGLLASGLDGRQIRRLQRNERARVREERRLEEVSAALEFAFEKVPFHRNRMIAAGMTPADVTCREDLQRIPVMTKADIRQHFMELVPEGVEVGALIESGGVTIGSTSGSTDERLQVLFSFELGRLPDRAAEIFDLSIELEKGAVLTSPRCAGFECHLGKSTMAERTRGSVLTLNSSDDFFSASDRELRAIASELAAFSPDVLFVNPWYGARFLERAKELGLDLPQLQAVLPSYQYLTRAHRELLARGFGAPVFSYYGATDLGGSLMGVECHRGSMHVREDQVHLELIEGRITVTTLNNRHMPLIRYQVGDLAQWASTCECEVGPEWAAILLEGREKDVIRDAGGAPVTTRMVDDCMGAAALFYQLEQRSADGYRVRISPEADAAEVEARLRTLLGKHALIDVERAEHFAPERSLKYRQTRPFDP